MRPALERTNPLSAEPDAFATLRRSGRTFWVASLLLPPRVRRELATLYEFCRLVDDCGDLAIGEESAALLGTLEDALVGGRDDVPIVNAFRTLAADRGVPLLLAQQLVEGVRSDLGTVRVRTESELLRYAYRVASTVGLMICRVLDVDSAGDPFAVDLGIGMQLTNIARDVAEDAGMGRVYLPAEWVGPEVVLHQVGKDRDEAVATGVERLLVLADRYYDSAERGMHYLPISVRPGLRAAGAGYRAIGDVIRRDPIAAVSDRVRTSGLTKLRKSGGAFARSVHDSIPGRAIAHNPRLHAALAGLT